MRAWSDLDEYHRLTTRYSGPRILIADRSDWSAARIIAAYRGRLPDFVGSAIHN